MKFKNVVEFFKNPKNRSISWLIFYGIFFIFVYIVLNSKEPQVTINPNENPKEDIYSYVVIINDNNNSTEILGLYENNKDTFTYNGLTYIKQDNNIYLDNNIIEDLDINVDLYKYKTIELLMEDSDSITTYKEEKKEVYNIGASKYYNILNDSLSCTSIDCTDLNISITVEKSEYINHVIIDLSEYYNYPYNIDIKYNIQSKNTID